MSLNQYTFLGCPDLASTYNGAERDELGLNHDEVYSTTEQDEMMVSNEMKLPGYDREGVSWIYNWFLATMLTYCSELSMDDGTFKRLHTCAIGSQRKADYAPQIEITVNPMRSQLVCFLLPLKISAKNLRLRLSAIGQNTDRYSSTRAFQPSM